MIVPKNAAWLAEQHSDERREHCPKLLLGKKISMACPDCGSALGEFRITTAIETHGLDCGPFERFEQEFILCRHCGGRFDVSDWDDTPELSGPPDAGAGGCSIARASHESNSIRAALVSVELDPHLNARK
jgi:hypothetical protein